MVVGGALSTRFAAQIALGHTNVGGAEDAFAQAREGFGKDADGSDAANGASGFFLELIGKDLRAGFEFEARVVVVEGANEVVFREITLTLFGMATENRGKIFFANGTKLV